MLTELVVFSIVFSILLILDIVGNTMVILAILKYRAMKTPMNYLLLNLAVADIMVGVFFAPRFILSAHLFTHPTGTIGDVLCKTLTGMTFSWAASLASAFTLVCVAVERFYAVVHQTSIRLKITKKKIKLILPVCWLLATALTIPSFISNSFDADKKLCREIYTQHWHYVLFWFMWVVAAGIIPVSLMAVLYARIIHSLWILTNSNAIRLAVINARKSITKKSITVSIFYAVCVFPTHIFYFLSLFYPDVFSENDLYFKTAYCMLVMNSSVNPFVYTFQCIKFRKYLKKLVRCE